MRNLTVKREKSFVACLITMKVFAEDKEHGETVIDGTPCRRIGELKNGEEKTFPIGEDDVKIFVIADELSKSFCFDCYALPAGSEDVLSFGTKQIQSLLRKFIPIRQQRFRRIPAKEIGGIAARRS